MDSRRLASPGDNVPKATPALACVLSVALMFFGVAAMSAETYPARAVRIIVPSSPGGGSDILARLLAQKLSTALDKPFVVENRPGGGSRVGTEIVARAAPDGYTLLLVDSSHVVNPALYSSVPYDPIKDFAPITQLARQDNVLVVNPSFPAQSVNELVALAKSKKREITYSSSGVGTAAHLGMEMFKSATGIEALHVPYQGTSPAIVAVVANDVDCLIAALPAALPQVKSGKLRALAVTSRVRSPALPDVPTMAESGYPGVDVEGWKGMVAPAKTPPEVIAKLHDELVKALALADVKERLEADGSQPVGGTSAEFLDYLHSETDKWTKVIKQAGVHAD
jgi:tripartite-type tricarboxylate transporter receptor subunit TctC